MNDKTASHPPGGVLSKKARKAEERDGERLAALAKAIAHPARVSILRILARRDACMCGDIVGEMTLAQSTVSEHLRILKEAGLISGVVDGPRVCYCLNPDALNELKTLVNDLPCPNSAPNCLEAYDGYPEDI